MSDHGKAAGFSNIFRGSGVTRPQDPHQLQRMGHWKHINSILASSIPRNPADNADVQEEECSRKGQSLLAQFWKSKETGKRNRQMPGHVSSPAMSDDLHSVEDMIVGKGTRDITTDCLIKENAGAFEAERMVLSNTSVCRMERSCVDWRNADSSDFLHLGVVSSEWQRYPEFDFNQKTQSLVRSKRKYGSWDARLDRDQLQTIWSGLALTPDELKAMPGDFQFQGEYMVQLSRLYRSFEKKRLCHSGPLQNDYTGSASGYELGGISQMRDAGPSVFTRDENNHSVSGVTYKEKLASHKCLHLENEAPEPCEHSLLSFSKNKRDEKRMMECSWPMPKDQSPKACGDSPTDVSGNELLLIKRSSMPGLMELKESLCEQHLQKNVPGFSIHDVRRYTTVDSVGRPLGISMNDEEGGRSVDSYSTDIDTQNVSHVEIACLDIGAPGENGLPEGVSSSRSDKKDFTGMQNRRKSESTCQDVVGMQNTRKSESTSTLQMKEAIISNQETELLDTSLNISPRMLTGDIVEPQGLSLSRTDAMDVGHIVSEFEKPENSGSSHQPENLLGTEVSSRWVKRLKVNLDSAIGTRDYNMEDVLTTRRVHKLFSRVMNYSRSNSFTQAKCLQECQQFQKTMLLLRNNDSPVESLKESYPWIQRWCQKGEETARPKTRKSIEVLCEPEKTKALPENLEGKLFPSLAAMALMGKAINNFRPCEVRRRGSSLVWNTEGFSRPEYSSTCR